jgi:periplasmic divalent cation tolerance protein
VFAINNRPSPTERIIMSEFLQVVTTTNSRDAAQAIASGLVERRLAACVQVSGPIDSTYRWQGKVETSQEWMCLIKTARSRYSVVEEAIRELHSYDEPEILAFAVAEGSRGYLDWIASTLDEASGA